MFTMSDNNFKMAEPPLGVGNTLLSHHHNHSSRRPSGDNPVGSISEHWGPEVNVNATHNPLPFCCSQSLAQTAQNQVEDLKGLTSRSPEMCSSSMIVTEDEGEMTLGTSTSSSSFDAEGDSIATRDNSPPADFQIRLPLPLQMAFKPDDSGSPSASELSYRHMVDLKELRDAIEMLLQMYKLFGENVRRDELSNFVEFYTEVIVRLVPPPPVALPLTGSFVQADLFSCPICYGVLREPVTIQCGHSYCRRCISTQGAGDFCHRCKYVITPIDNSNIKTNVLIGSLVEKWWAQDISSPREEGFQEHIEKDTEQDLLSIPNTMDSSPASQIRGEETLVDAEATIKACPYWAKGYFCKAVTLAAMGKLEDAFTNLSICLYLVKGLKLCDESSLLPVKAELCKVLDKIFISAMALSFRRHSFEQIQFYPYPNPKKQFLLSMSLREQERLAGLNSDNNSESENSSGDESSERSNLSVPSPTHSSSPTKSSGYLRHLTKFKGGSHHRATDRSTPTFEAQAGKIHKLFNRSFAELNRLHDEIIELRSSLAGRTAGNDQTGHNLSFRSVDQSLISPSDFDCTLCYRLFHQPVTTTCGHTYCRSCLERSLDHSPYCPLCKASLEEYLAVRRHSIDEFIEVAISKFLPKERTERMSQHLEELNAVALNGKDPEMEIPIFVCTMAFPTVPCPLHVFEPRYRLMIRRCMESGFRRFGMCCYLHDGENSYGEYGTLLEIKNVQYFPDGRSVVDTIGTKRFQILRKGVRDGYNTAVIEYLKDESIENECERQKVLEMQEQVYSEASEWLKTVNRLIQQRIYSHFGLMPRMTPEDIDSEDGPAWIWWLLAVLPLDPKAQLAILSMSSLKKRLESIQKVLKYVKSSQI